MRLLVLLIALFIAETLATPQRVTFSKTFLESALAEFRGLAGDSATSVTWSSKLEKASWNVAKKCSQAALDKTGNNVLATSLGYTSGLPLKYHNDMTLAYVEDLLEDFCPNLLGDPKLASFGCAVARCPKAKGKSPSNLKKDKWDSIVCTYNIHFKGHCEAGSTGSGPGKSAKSNRVTFSSAEMTKLQNDLRRTRSPKLNPIKWDKKLEQTAYLRARACNPNLSQTSRGNEYVLEILEAPGTSWDDLDLKLNTEDHFDQCPGIIVAPKLTKFGCAAVLCGRRPKADIHSPWRSVVCEYNVNASTKCNQ